MRTTVLLALLPLALAGTLLPEPKSPYTGVKKPLIAAQADTFRQRFEPVYPVHTFEQRWWPGEGLTFDERWSPIAPLQGTVRTIRITKPPPEPPHEVVAAINTAVPLPEPKPNSVSGKTNSVSGKPNSVKPRPIRVANICEKHGLRKIETGRTWRCKK